MEMDRLSGSEAQKFFSEEALLSMMSNIPNKMAFKIGEAADLVGVKQYVLRYWESEFDALRPKKAPNGQRIYTRKEIEMALMIRTLLYTHRFSIEGARSALKGFRQELSEQMDWKRAQEAYDRARNKIVDLANEIRRVRHLFE